MTPCIRAQYRIQYMNMCAWALEIHITWHTALCSVSHKILCRIPAKTNALVVRLQMFSFSTWSLHDSNHRKNILKERFFYNNIPHYITYYYCLYQSVLRGLNYAITAIRSYSNYVYNSDCGIYKFKYSWTITI